MEQLLLSAMMRDREAYSLIKDYIIPSKYSREFQILTEKIGLYYTRDKAVKNVEPAVLFAQLQETIRSDKHLEVFKKAIQEADSLEHIPEQNIKEIVFQAKKQEKADQLATALVNNPEGAIALAREFLELTEVVSLEALDEAEVEDDDVDDLEAILAEELSNEGRLPVYPESLGERLRGGLKGGHDMTIFGRPEAGKTTLGITVACGFAHHGHTGIYCGNEDRRRDLLMRFIGNLSGMTLREIEKNPQEAIRIAKKNGLDNVKIIAMTPGSLELIERLIKKHKASWCVVDQLRNLNVRNESRVNQLDVAAQGVRNLGKKYNCVMVALTQAGDSGNGKAVLEMGDVDYSNTGIPAAADVLVGLGVTAALEAEGRRVISLPKNKISGLHESFPVKIETGLSRILSIG